MLVFTAGIVSDAVELPSFTLVGVPHLWCKLVVTGQASVLLATFTSTLLNVFDLSL